MVAADLGWAAAATPEVAWLATAPADGRRLAECPWPDPPAPADDRQFLRLDALARAAARAAAFTCLGRRSWQLDDQGKARVHCGRTHGWARVQARWEARRQLLLDDGGFTAGDRSLGRVFGCRLPAADAGGWYCHRWWCPYCRYRQARLVAWRFLLGAEAAVANRQRPHARLMLVRLEAAQGPLNPNPEWSPQQSLSPGVLDNQRRHHWGADGLLLRPTTADLAAGWIFGGPPGRQGSRPGVPFEAGRSAVPDDALPGRPVGRLSVFQPVRLRTPQIGQQNAEPDDRSDWDFVWGVRESVVALCWVYEPGRWAGGRRRAGAELGLGPLGRPLSAASPARVIVSHRHGVSPVGRFAPAVRPYTPRALAAAVGQALRLPGWVGRGPTDGLYPHFTATSGPGTERLPVRRVVFRGPAVDGAGDPARLAAHTPGAGDARWRARVAADPAAYARLLCRQAVAVANAALDGPAPGGVQLSTSARRRLSCLRNWAARLGEDLRLVPGRVTGRPGHPARAAALRYLLHARRLRAGVLALSPGRGPAASPG